jgi:cytochrome c biogenesis protein CcmG/thiol:disulfide interchange protein DsbE
MTPREVRRFRVYLPVRNKSLRREDLSLNMRRRRWLRDCYLQNVPLITMPDVFHRAHSRFAATLLFFVLAAGAGALEPAPAGLKLSNRDGRPFSLDSLKGNVVVLDFWASWCVPCRASFPVLDTLQAKYASQGLRVVGLTLEDDDEAVETFLDGVPVAFPIVRDPSGHAGEALGVVAMPTTFLLDRDGRVVARFEGGDKSVHARLEAAVSALLAGGTLPSGTDVRVASSLEATGKVKAWRRGYLADPIMSLDGDAITRMLREHIHASKEAAAGDGGPTGGGCGCN